MFGKNVRKCSMMRNTKWAEIAYELACLWCSESRTYLFHHFYITYETYGSCFSHFE